MLFGLIVLVSEADGIFQDVLLMSPTGRFLTDGFASRNQESPAR